ncbi:MAG TPA: hypothetical protein VEH31_01975 [Streptosporangiaceae bacterium]|nr:hypothetical protein [Streptosporangiaceae bacterium]
MHHDGDRGSGRADLPGQGDALSSSGRVVARVEIFSAKIRVTPAARSEPAWVSIDWRTVEARAYPMRTCPAGTASAAEAQGSSVASSSCSTASARSSGMISASSADNRARGS